MKKLTQIGAISLLALCMAATSWAGGSSCSSDGAKATSAGAHCSGTKASNATHEACTVGANQVMYSFSVPSVECQSCIDTIQKSAMATKGIACAHVDLATHTAYVIADKSVSQKDISKMIATAGYKNKYVAQGDKVQAAFAKAMASGDKGVNCCAKNKDKA